MIARRHRRLTRTGNAKSTQLRPAETVERGAATVSVVSNVLGASMLSVITWNVHQNAEAWSYLPCLRDDHGAQIALLQEAQPPPSSNQWPGVTPDPLEPALWRLPVPPDVRRRDFASAIVVLDGTIEFGPILACPLSDAPPTGRQPWSAGLAASHPGQFSVARIELDGHNIVLVSLYGI